MPKYNLLKGLRSISTFAIENAPFFTLHYCQGHCFLFFQKWIFHFFWDMFYHLLVDHSFTHAKTNLEKKVGFFFKILLCGVLFLLVGYLFIYSFIHPKIQFHLNVAVTSKGFDQPNFFFHPIIRFASITSPCHRSEITMQATMSRNL